jgi:2-keto-3-deoxy-6-phosphogluconate aldolase
MVVEVLEVTVLLPGRLEMLVFLERRRQEAVLVGAGTPVTGVLGVAG